MPPRSLPAAGRALAAITCALVIGANAGTADAGHSVFHLFTPAIEPGHWGFEALSGFAFGLPGRDDPESDADAHGSPRAAHELALHRGVTSYWQTKLALGLERQDQEDYRATYVATENVIRFTPPRDGPVDLAWFTSLSAGLDSDVAHSVEFGPIVSWTSGPFALVINPFFEKSFGRNREDGIAFTYGWRATYEITERLSVGIEGYGEIENIADRQRGSEQVHRIGPVLYLGHVHGSSRHARHEDSASDRHAPASRHVDDAAASGHSEHGSDWHAEVGVLFGLTEATPDAALKLNVGVDF